MPLEEILRLYRENEEAKRPEAPKPPISATVHRLEMEGRVLDHAVEVRARVSIEVLAEGEWVAVPFLAVDDGVSLSKLPDIANAVLTTQDGQLALLTKKRGRYDFVVSFVRHASIDAETRQAQIEVRGATLALLQLSLDRSVFEWTGESGRAGSEGLMLYPEGDTFALSWKRVAEAPAPSRVGGDAPRSEPVIPALHASTVSTLEGKRITRLLYKLSFAGEQTIDFEIPTGQSLERVYLHGATIPAVAEGGKLSVLVRPKRDGDTGGMLELVLVTTGKSYHLSGDLGFDFPRTSWPVNEVFVALSLPPVFNYEWSGGSLSPVEKCAKTNFSYEIPAPGKRLAFHQYLVHASAPNLTLAYDVDLEGHYFRP